MLLKRDAFEIEYEPARVNVEEIEGRIRRLGYKPHQVDPDDAEPPSESERRGALPDPVARVAREAARASKLLCLDFYAAWCGPCKVLEQKVLPAPAVQRALADFAFLKVDTDKFPEAAEYFEIVGLPTLIVLDDTGNERFRHLGPISPEALVQALEEAKRNKRH